MALYVIRPDDPAVGADWAVQVPGQYIWDITGITATLTTAIGGDEPTDASGNGYNGVYVHPDFPLTFVPGALTGDDALLCGSGTPKVARAGFTIPPAAMPFTGDFTVIWWGKRFNVGGDTAHDLQATNVGTSEALSLRYNSGGSLALFINATGCAYNTGNVVPLDEQFHMIAFAYTASSGTAIIYLDGLPVATPIAIPGGPLSVTPETVTWGLASTGAPGMIGGTDELAYVPAVVSAGDIATLFAAAPVFAAYTAAMLALTPNVYYHLDGIGSPAGDRQVALEVTDGSTVTELIATGFAEGAGTGPFFYSWQPKLASSSQTADETTTTVAIPRLLLPAGYTAGTRTLDLGSNDRWTDITVWWDSLYMDTHLPVLPYAFPPGAHLIWEPNPNVHRV